MSVTFGIKRGGEIISLRKLQNAAKRKLTAYKKKGPGESHTRAKATRKQTKTEPA